MSTSVRTRTWRQTNDVALQAYSALNKHSTQLQHSITAPNHSTQSQHTITAYNHSTQSQHTITARNHSTQSQHSITETQSQLLLNRMRIARLTWSQADAASIPRHQGLPLASTPDPARPCRQSSLGRPADSGQVPNITRQSPSNVTRQPAHHHDVVSSDRLDSCFHVLDALLKRRCGTTHHFMQQQTAMPFKLRQLPTRVSR